MQAGPQDEGDAGASGQPELQLAVALGHRSNAAPVQQDSLSCR